MEECKVRAGIQWIPAARIARALIVRICGKNVRINFNVGQQYFCLGFTACKQAQWRNGAPDCLNWRLFALQVAAIDTNLCLTENYCSRHCALSVFVMPNVAPMRGSTIADLPFAAVKNHSNRLGYKAYYYPN